MLQFKAWKTCQKREDRPTDYFVSIGTFNEDDCQICPPMVMTQAKAVELLGPKVLEWPDDPPGTVSTTYPLKVVVL